MPANGAAKDVVRKAIVRKEAGPKVAGRKGAIATVAAVKVVEAMAAAAPMVVAEIGAAKETGTAADLAEVARKAIAMATAKVADEAVAATIVVRRVARRAIATSPRATSILVISTRATSIRAILIRDLRCRAPSRFATSVSTMKSIREISIPATSTRAAWAATSRARREATAATTIRIARVVVDAAAVAVADVATSRRARGAMLSHLAISTVPPAAMPSASMKETGSTNRALRKIKISESARRVNSWAKRMRRRKPVRAAPSARGAVASEDDAAVADGIEVAAIVRAGRPSDRDEPRRIEISGPTLRVAKNRSAAMSSASRPSVWKRQTQASRPTARRPSSAKVRRGRKAKMAVRADAVVVAAVAAARRKDAAPKVAGRIVATPAADRAARRDPRAP